MADKFDALTDEMIAWIAQRQWVWPVVVVFFVLIRQWFVMREEQLMVQTFGDEYTAYRGRVRRWL